MLCISMNLMKNHFLCLSVGISSDFFIEVILTSPLRFEQTSCLYIPFKVCNFVTYSNF